VKFGLKLFLFLFVFSVEIRVKAAVLLNEPAHCSKTSQSDCLVFSRAIGGKLHLENGTIYLGRDSLIYRDKTNAWHFLRGVVKLEVKKNFRISSIVGDFQAVKSEFLLQESNEKINLFVISGSVLPVPKSQEGKTFAISAGYTNWYGKINSYGFNDEGLPRPLLWRNFAKQIGFENWYLILKEKMRIKSNESEVVDNSAHFYLEVSQNISQNKFEREQTEDRRLRAREGEELNIRKLFRKKFEIESTEE
jgi:hypothetical protein